MTNELREKMSEFEKWLLVKKGISYVTIAGYKGSASRLIRNLKTFEPTHDQVINYIVKMHERGFSYSHIVNTSLALEWYTEFIGNRIQLGRPKKPRTIIKDTLSEAEITLLIDATKNVREKAIISLLAYSGIRNKELCRLKVSDVNLGENMLRVIQGKGMKDRLINISGDCSRIQIDYLNQFPRKADDYMFTTIKKGNRYDQSDLRKLVHVLAKRARINKRIYPHLLRHSLATNLLKRGANLYMIKEQLGHVFLETTATYLRTFPLNIRNQYHMFVPSYM